MFSYLRYFFAISVVIILAGTALFGWNYRSASLDIVAKQVQQGNMAFSQNFYNSVWRDNAGVMLLYYTVEPSARGDYREYHELGAKTLSLLQGTNIVRMNIYTPTVEVPGMEKPKESIQLFFAATPKKVITLPPGNDSAVKGYDDTKMSPLATFSDGKTKNEIVEGAEFPNANGAAASGTLVRTLIPVHYTSAQSGTNADVVLEIFTDVTDSANTLTKWQYIGAGLILGIFILLYITLAITSRRTEKIIERQHETNVELASAKSAAESQNQQKSQFLASISHELRTPLNAIIGFSEIIKDEVMGELNNEQYKNYIKDIHSSGVHLLSLINDILDYSKAEAGKLDMEYEDVDLTKLIASSLRLQEPRAKSAQVELLRELPTEHMVIRSDSKRLKQILLNLLSNSVKFTPAGGSVKISAWRNLQDHSKIFIEVKDSGIGIAPKDIAKALSPFGQVDSELSRRYEGTGLGLPLTKKFVELLGGELRLESELNKGTTVTISIPVNADPNGMAPSPQGYIQAQE